MAIPINTWGHDIVVPPAKDVFGDISWQRLADRVRRICGDSSVPDFESLGELVPVKPPEYRCTVEA